MVCVTKELTASKACVLIASMILIGVVTLLKPRCKSSATYRLHSYQQIRELKKLVI